uniref:UDP-glycosyltransferase n=1 Tax=Quercus lobata TaxID=97700 RepID=A0A7N2MPR3_QUELO
MTTECSVRYRRFESEDHAIPWFCPKLDFDTDKIDFSQTDTCPISPYPEWLGVVVKAEEYGSVRLQTCRGLNRPRLYPKAILYSYYRAWAGYNLPRLGPWAPTNKRVRATNYWAPHMLFGKFCLSSTDMDTSTGFGRIFLQLRSGSDYSGFGDANPPLDPPASVFENGNPLPTNWTFGSGWNRVGVGRFGRVVRLRSGTPIENNLIWLSKDIPAWSSTVLPWSCPGDSKTQKCFFESYAFKMNHSLRLCNWLLCNSFYELDSPACNLIPGIIPLDKQAMGSVIYVAFGSRATFSQQQFDELTLGLELISQPFLWVVRSDVIGGLNSEFLDGFRMRIVDRGKIVEWAPQEKVLAHPSIACFLSHCGWNSTLEGISMGVPFLCWPYYGDQFHNKSYICDVWKVGLGLNPDENGLITRHEIKTKIETLLSDDGVKINALKLKEIAKKSVTDGGSSFKNFKSFIEQIKH